MREIEVRWNAASAKTEQSLERPCPSMSVVLGHVGDIGEIAQAIIPFERVSTTTYRKRPTLPRRQLMGGVLCSLAKRQQ